jgi:hypothetical protein
MNCCNSNRCQQGRKTCPTPNACRDDEPIITPDDLIKQAAIFLAGMVVVVICICLGLILGNHFH